MSTSVMSLNQGRPTARRKRNFTFNKGDLVLVKWADGMVYFAKIKHIYHRREKCVVVFDDKSQDEADFSQIHSVDETTTDIICIKCKKDDSDSPNEIVLCDKCGIGFHQKCHNPTIPASALQLDNPWICSYCQRGIKCPYLNESISVLQNWWSDDNESVNGEESCNGIDSEDDNMLLHNTGDKTKPKKSPRAGAKTTNEKRKSLCSSSPSTLSSLATTVLREKSQNDISDIKNMSLSLSESEDVTAEVVSSSRKRKKYTPLHKRQKRPSVESHTVSVTRLDSPIFTDCMDTFPTISKDKGLKTGSPKREKRSLRVSLSLPEEIDKRYLKGYNGTTTVRSDSISPTVDATTTSPSSKLNHHVSNCDMVVEEDNNVESLVASSLPVVTSQGQAESSHPSSSSEVVKEDTCSVTKSSEVVTESTVISSCQSPLAEVPADSSTSDKCFSTDKTEQELVLNESCPTAENTTVCMVSNSNIEEKATATPDVSAAENIDTAAIPIPTTLPVIIEKSVYYPSSEGVVSPTKPIVSGNDQACEAGEGNCAQLTPISTGSESFPLSQLENKDDSPGTAISSVSATTADSASSPRASSQVETDSARQTVTSGHVQSFTPVSLSQSSAPPTSGSLNSVSNDVSVQSLSAPTSVITSSFLVPKPKSDYIPSNCTNSSKDEMSKLDKQLAAVIGYDEAMDCRDEAMDCRDEASKSKEATMVQTEVLTSISDGVSSTQKSGQSKVPNQKKLDGSNENVSKVESTKKNCSAVTLDPDVIITSVEPSKERSNGDVSPPPGKNVNQVSSGSRPSSIPNKTSTTSLTSQVSQDSSRFPPPPFPGHSTIECSSIKSPQHATHAIYSPGTRVPVGYQPRTNSVIYTPNGQAVYYTSMQQENSVATRPGVKPPGGVPASKPSVASRIGAEVPSRNVDARRMGSYVVVDGMVPQMVPVSPHSQGTIRVPPDSTIEAESHGGTIRAGSTITSPSDEKDKIPRKKFAQKDIQFIQKKLGDACNSYDVSMFMAAFNEAWQKFQANASNYEEQALVLNSKVTLGQAPDGSQQFQLVSTKPRVVAPKLSSSATESGANSPASPPFGSATGIPQIQQQPQQQTQMQQTQMQQQYVFQHIANAPHYVYAVPAPVAGGHPSHSATQPKVGCPIQASSAAPGIVSLAPPVQYETSVIQSNSGPPLGQSKPQVVGNHFRTRPVVQQAKVAATSSAATVIGSSNGVVKASTPTKKNKPCSRCGKSATFICSGCKKEWYCGKDCQLDDWILHSKNCHT